jgi:hypothetical protein
LLEHWNAKEDQVVTLATIWRRSGQELFVTQSMVIDSGKCPVCGTPKSGWLDEAVDVCASDDVWVRAEIGIARR